MRQLERNKLQNSLGSPLRIRLVAELLDSSEGLALREAVLLTGRHAQDVQAVLRPMVEWELVTLDGDRYCIAADADPDAIDLLRAECDARRDFIERERGIRRSVLCGMIGVDPKMQMVFESIIQLSRLDVPVLVTGETGTGKEMVARAIHQMSPRRERAFGAVNCGTLTDELFATEIFGHVRGAFTGAVRDHAGWVERADGGTLFLDELADLPAANQVKLLRLLQDGTYNRVGDERTRRANIRVVSATNRDLEQAVLDGDFREDLYYRLNVFPLRLPSLRERLDDLPFLVSDLLAGKLARFSTRSGGAAISDAALEALRAHDWPGNIRELENVLMQAVVAAGAREIRPEHIPEFGRLSTAARLPSSPLRSLAEVEAAHIQRVLDHVEGNISAASRILGISRTTLYQRLKS